MFKLTRNEMNSITGDNFSLRNLGNVWKAMMLIGDPVKVKWQKYRAGEYLVDTTTEGI